MRHGNVIAIFGVAMAICGVIAFSIVPQYDRKIANMEAQQTAASIETATPVAPEPAQQSVNTVEPSGKAAVLRKKPDGHYWGLADVDGFPVNFMVDTGASVVVLTYKDATRLRLKPDELEYKWKISTAGGETKGASVLLESIRIGGVEIQNVEAMVLRDGLKQSLLGMTFLGELYSYEFRGKQLIIRQ